MPTARAEVCLTWQASSIDVRRSPPLAAAIFTHLVTQLDASCVLQNGRAASATTIARKRSVFANVLRYAVEMEELSSSPPDRLSWKPPKVSAVVDRRVVVLRRLPTARTVRPWSAADGLVCLHVLRCSAACRSRGTSSAGLLSAAAGWGRLTLEKSRPEVTAAGPTLLQLTRNAV